MLVLDKTSIHFAVELSVKGESFHVEYVRALNAKSCARS